MTLTQQDKDQALNWLDSQVNAILQELGASSLDEGLKMLSEGGKCQT